MGEMEKEAVCTKNVQSGESVRTKNVRNGESVRTKTVQSGESVRTKTVRTAGIGIIDYGMGNLRSVEKAFQFLGFNAEIVSSRKQIQQADKILLPGVGAFADAISTIRRYEFDKEIHDAIRNGKPFLGICLGMQLLFSTSYENGLHQGLGVFDGDIVRLSETEKIPQIGWNSLNIKRAEPLLTGLPQEPYVYFVHSYYLETTQNIVSATTVYGKEIQIGVQKDNVFAFQFHPEKSGDTGLKILKNFGGL